MNKGKTILPQIMSLFNENVIMMCADRYKGNWYAIKFNCRYQFMVLHFAQFIDRTGLRGNETLVNLCGDRYRSEFKGMPQSTLAEANEKKDWHIYQDFTMTAVKGATALYKNGKLRIGLEVKINAFDSSTIELCLNLFPRAEFHHHQGAFKMHTLMDLRSAIPTFVLFTPGKVIDTQMMDEIPVDAGSVYLTDKGYVAFEQFYKYFPQKGTFFVMRTKDNLSDKGIEPRPVNKSSRVLSDGTIKFTAHYSARKSPDELKLVVCEDFETGKVYRCLTNNFAIEAPLTIEELYREHW